MASDLVLSFVFHMSWLAMGGCALIASILLMLFAGRDAGMPGDAETQAQERSSTRNAPEPHRYSSGEAAASN